MSGHGSWEFGGGSSSNYGAPYEPADPEEHAEEEGAPAFQEAEGVYEVDAPSLDFESDQELEVCGHLKDRVFQHTTLYDDKLLQEIGMKDEFDSIWRAVGWESIDPLDEPGSRLLTIQFICTLGYDDKHVYFRLFHTDYQLTWRELAHHIGLNHKSAIKIDQAIPGFERNAFWERISGRVETGKFKPLHTQIQHPTLRLIHRWISMNFFPCGKIRWVHSTELKLLFAIVHKIKVAPVREICAHWLDSIKKSYAISCTSVITRLANALGVLTVNDTEYIPVERPICVFRALNQGHTIKRDEITGNYCFFFPGYANKIPLPNPGLRLYNCDVLTFDLKTAEEVRRVGLELQPSAGETSASAPPPQPTPWEAYQGYAGYSAWEQYPQPPQPSGQAWGEVGADEWERQRRYTVDSPPQQQEPTLHGLDARIGALQIQTGNIETTLDNFMQSTNQWQHQFGQRFDTLAETLRAQHEQQRAFWRSQGWDPEA